MSFVTALKAELQQIEALLAKDPNFRRAQRIRELLAEYESGQVPEKHDFSVVVTYGGKGKFERVKEKLTELMAEHSPLHRKFLLDQLIAAGLMGKEKDPMASLAHYLTTSGFFKNDGSGNWSLK